ncbi:AraC family transcriptional regulator [Pseudoxanthomonas broegbernensis]|uniref:AraC family transcriptional regulator n=1 Tax=Pseudoxanthomonas broegbernensis TaxID=83619 RepID=A0A7V8GK46_9GAMM|nr:helix-turn-helix domain-containing protein [Pseudoxanthomonas broegbernensis]KAF1684755.1 AraC family transcriptional regulator [Pseudoxanthomonas broegbernensis]MBB6064175.1 transcriptional regulator GlxA family with amidase domain [Pseudoxanthomonas broegbernensis]
MALPRVAVVAFDRISPFHLSVPCMVLDGHATRRAPVFDLRVCAPEPGTLRTDAGFGLHVRHGLRTLDRADIVVVPSWHGAEEPAPPALCRALRRAHARGARLVGLCLGSFVLADAGLLDGRPATTHWAAMEAFARRHPRVSLQPDVLYVDDGDVLTSAGTAAGIDCCLHLVRQWHGAAVAGRIARGMVVAPHRQGGQAQYIEQPLPADAGDARLDAVLAWALAHLDTPLDVDALATRALMSRRTFTRRFRQATGSSPLQWLAHQRLVRAQRLLEETGAPLERVAAQAGFGSAASLRLRFSAALGVSPSAWRRSFRGRA